MASSLRHRNFLNELDHTADELRGWLLQAVWAKVRMSPCPGRRTKGAAPG